MSKTVASIMVVGLTTMSAGHASAMDLGAHAAGAQTAALAIIAALLITFAAIARVHRRHTTPRLAGGLMTWAMRKHGL